MTRIVVIGGGPAGIEAALTAAQAGCQVTLVSDAPIGGRAGWHSLLPSKVWLTAADTLGLLQGAASLGLHAGGARVDTAVLLERIQSVKSAWNSQLAAQLDELGVATLSGTAVFAGPDSVSVRDQSGELVQMIEADVFIVTSGSVPTFPPGLKPDGKRVLAPRFASHLADLPERVVVIGAGPTGCEFAYLFNRIGVDVTWVVDPFGVLPQFHADAGRFLGQALARRGVQRVDGLAQQIERADDGVTVVLTDGTALTAGMAFVAIGRAPDWSRLDLAAAGVALPGGRPLLDGYGRAASNARVYFAGDADGGWMIANKALAQARVAGLHAAGRPTAPYNPAETVLATYSEPQVAQVGAVDDGPDVVRQRVSYGAALKAHLLPEADGYVELFVGQGDGRVRGGVAVGPHAADVLAPLALGLRLGVTVDDLAAVYAAHPTLSELVFTAARVAA